MFLLNNLSNKIRNFNNLYIKHIIVLGIICFFFLWDISFNIYQNISISFREFFYLIFIYLIFDYKKKYNKNLIKIILFLSFFLIYNLIVYNLSFDQLDFRYNLLPLLFIFLVFFICDFYKEEILSNLRLSFIIFIYLLIFSYGFSDIYNLSPMEKTRVCGIFSFTIRNHFFFLEPSHLGMILVPFYYYVFRLGKINLINKIILLIFLAFIFLFNYSLTLLLSVIGCFLLMLLVDYRFFIKNKLFFLCQLLIIVTPILQSSCVYKANNVIENLNFITQDKENSKYTFYSGDEKYYDYYSLDRKHLGDNYDGINLDGLSMQLQNDLKPFIDDIILEEKMDYWDFKEKLIKLASEYPEEAIIDISEALIQYKGWKKDNPGGTYDEFLEEQGLKRVELSNGGYAEDYKDKVFSAQEKREFFIQMQNDLKPFIDDNILEEKMDYWDFKQKLSQKYKDKAFSAQEKREFFIETNNFAKANEYKKYNFFLNQEVAKINKIFDEITKQKIKSLIPRLKPKIINYFIVKNNFLFSVNIDSSINDHTSAVLINSFKVAYHAIKERPFGWGFNNYQSAFNKFMIEKIVPKFPQIYYLNHNDGSNNFIKLIVEFGVLSLIVFFNLIYFTLNRKISPSQRILFGGIILIQMMRGAGYFNGGFIFCLVFTFILNYQSLKNNEK